MILNLFYEEPDPDRWLPLDHYPRSLIRRAIRGPRRPGGQERVFLNLCAGLDQLGIAYRINDYNYARKHPNELVCIIGKPHVLDKVKWKNPILFGAAVFSHPLSYPDLLERLSIERILVPGEWMRKMCEPYWGDKVSVWPVGIDTEQWHPSEGEKTTDFLIYDKVRWEHDRYENELIEPIKKHLADRNLTSTELRYGSYQEDEFQKKLQEVRAMIFLCEHETQGIAYQQALSSGIPILVWDRGGFWQDPEFYPERVKFSPVSSVPYWDERCGEIFKSAEEFPNAFSVFWDRLQNGGYRPRDYILENLTLVMAAKSYVAHWNNALPTKMLL